MSLQDYDEESIRCPRLGDFVPFKFCRTSGQPFCWAIISCWAVRLDIGRFLADHYSAEEIEKGLTRPAAGDRRQKLIEMTRRFR